MDSQTADFQVAAYQSGYQASTYAECPYSSAQAIWHDWIAGMVDKAVETGVVPSDAPMGVLGRIAFRQGASITDMPAGQIPSGPWVSGWITEKDRGDGFRFSVGEGDDDMPGVVEVLR